MPKCWWDFQHSYLDTTRRVVHHIETVRNDSEMTVCDSRGTRWSYDQTSSTSCLFLFSSLHVLNVCTNTLFLNSCLFSSLASLWVSDSEPIVCCVVWKFERIYWRIHLINYSSIKNPMNPLQSFADLKEFKNCLLFLTNAHNVVKKEKVNNIEVVSEVAIKVKIYMQRIQKWSKNKD